jgi:hypothetical protein
MAMGAGIIWPAFRRCPDVVDAPRRVGIVGAAFLAVVALAAIPDANADPPPGCFKGSGPQPVPDCGMRAFEADIAAAGLRDTRGNTVALDHGLDMCGLIDRGLSQQEMANQFLGTIRPWVQTGRHRSSGSPSLTCARGAAEYKPAGPRR